MAASAAGPPGELDTLLAELAELTKTLTLDSARATVPLCDRILAIDPKNQAATMFRQFARRVVDDPKILERAAEESSEDDSDNESDGDSDEGAPARGAAAAASASASSSSRRGRGRGAGKLSGASAKFRGRG